MTKDYEHCNASCEKVVHCKVCGLRKKPISRDAAAAMANSLCDSDCPGYMNEPIAGHLWPGELASIREQERKEAT